jgi:hypothetical protein
MVLAYLGYDLPEAQIARILHAYSFGTPAPNIRYLETLDFTVKFGATSLAKLRSYLKDDTPCIVFVRADDLPYAELRGFHAIVVIGIDENPDSTSGNVYVNDPALESGPQRVSVDHFMLVWSEFDYEYAVIVAK